MKALAVGLTVVVLLALWAISYAHSPGWFGGQMGGNYGGHMMGQGFGGHMMGWTNGYDQAFLDGTADLRRDINNKRFEYFEAVRNPETTPDTITRLENELRELQEKLYGKSPRRTFGRFGGFGRWW